MDSLKKDPYRRCLDDIFGIISKKRTLFIKKLGDWIVEMHWEIGNRIVAEEQKGEKRAEYGKELIAKLSLDLLQSGEKGFGVTNLKCMRQFHLTYPEKELIRAGITWTHYQRLIRLDTDAQRRFYEDLVIRGHWSVKDLERGIHTFLYERTIGNTQPREARIESGESAKPLLEESIKDPYMLDFLKLQAGQYQESDLEKAIISHIEEFLMELGAGFSFVSRQKRVQIGEDDFYVDLVFFHRGLKCLVLIDLKWENLRMPMRGK